MAGRRAKTVDVSKQVDVISSCFGEMTALTEQLESMIRTISNMSAAEMRAQASDLEVRQQSNQKRFNRQEGLVENALTKIRGADVKAWTLQGNRKKEVVDRYRILSRQYSSLGVSREAAAAAQAELFAGRAAAEVVDPSAGNDAMIGATAGVLRDTVKDAKDGTRRLEEVKGQLTAATARVVEDNEKLKEAEAKLTEIDSEAELASKVVRNMLKRVYTDKLLLIFIGLVVLGILGIIIYSAVVPSNDFNVPDVAKPPSPECVQKMANGQTC